MDPSAVLHTAFVLVLIPLEHLLQLSCIKFSYLFVVIDHTLSLQIQPFPMKKKFSEVTVNLCPSCSMLDVSSAVVGLQMLQQE